MYEWDVLGDVARWRGCWPVHRTVGVGPVIVLQFRAPAKVWSINQTAGSHWGKVYQDKREWQSAAHIYYLRWRNTHGFRAELAPWDKPYTVTVTLPFVRRSAKRDPHNYTSTVVKWIIDGLVYAGAWPDDGPEYVTVIDPILVKDPDLMVRIEIEAR